MSAATAVAAPVRAATRGVYTAFTLMGFASASWAARIPQVRDKLELSPSGLGLVLLAIAAGSIVSLVLAGQIVAHFGSRRTVTVMAGLLGLALSGVAIGYQFGVLPVVIALFLAGFANGGWDVAMNVQGTVVERHLGKAIMPRFHAGYSVGTVVGALVGAGAVAVHLSVTAHLMISAILVAIVVMLGVQAFMPDDPADIEPPVPIEPAHAAPPASRVGRALATWREPRTLLIGLFVLAFAFTEGAGLDWISIAMIDGYGVPATVGTLAFATFLAAMTAGRWFGPGWLDRYGRVLVVRALAGVSLVGLALFVFGTVPAIAFVGVLLWGLGASLGFPVGMSAAADDPAHAAPRVSVVATIGYCAFLGGPPLVGFLGDHVTVLKGLLAVAALLAVAIALADSVKPLRPAHD
ncbi:MFS transporter [Paractinoplanes durhamensis]|uniref:MFS transporter n=1 Tax=Paractinoplanes durhamensis TaxID=113563 RepID=A0ABQ3Z1C8_9ACTN|nr:MFS transporter [Actinoplanes durhamensis]GIE03628.1 MFS transporter [Actinoplanes durhamensis]